jgi:hypothetical protein
LLDAFFEGFLAIGAKFFSSHYLLATTTANNRNRLPNGRGILSVLDQLYCQMLANSLLLWARNTYRPHSIAVAKEPLEIYIFSTGPPNNLQRGNNVPGTPKELELYYLN